MNEFAKRIGRKQRRVTILDTNHITVLQRGNEPMMRLQRRLVTETDPIAVAVISVEEQMKGRLAQIKRAPTEAEEIIAHANFLSTVKFFHSWSILPFTSEASARYADLRKSHRRTGAMDLKIAAIALANNATVATANLRDFEQIPDLKCENWLA